MFTTPCFIRKNTPELMQKLWELGYHIYPTCRGIDIINPYIFAHRWYYAQSPIGRIEEKKLKWIDCGENEDLFLAIAALRDDSDYMQWFCDEIFAGSRRFALCKQNSWKEYFTHITDGDCGSYKEWHKATVEELIEHFNHGQKRNN